MRILAILLALAGTVAAAENMPTMSPAEAADPQVRNTITETRARWIGWHDQRDGVAPANSPAADSVRSAAARGWLVRTSAEEPVLPRPMRDLYVVEVVGLVARDWQGAQGLVAIDRGPAPWIRIAGGLAVERLAVRDAGTTGAVEAVLRADTPVRFATGTTIGPAVTGRVGISGNGLVAGWDAGIHAEHLIGHGLSVVIDAGVGHRRDDGAVSAVAPEVGVGLTTDENAYPDAIYLATIKSLRETERALMASHAAAIGRSAGVTLDMALQVEP